MLKPLANHMDGQPVYALEPNAWRAFLLSLLNDEKREDAAVQYLADHLARVLHRALIPAFLDVVAKDLESKGPLYGKINLRFLGRIDETTRRTEGKVDEILDRVTPSKHLAGLQLFGTTSIRNTGFRAWLESSRLPYYSLAEHLYHNPAPAGFRIRDEERLLDVLTGETQLGLILTGRGGVGKTRLGFELGVAALRRDWPVWLVRGKNRHRYN